MIVIDFLIGVWFLLLAGDRFGCLIRKVKTKEPGQLKSSIFSVLYLSVGLYFTIAMLGCVLAVCSQTPEVNYITI